MPNKLKREYPNAEAVPDNLKGAYEKASDSDKYVLIELGDDVPIVQTKNSLEETQKTLKEDLRKEKDKVTRLEANQLPQGKIPVDPEIEKLGNAAKTAGVTAEEIPTLKTAKDDLQKQLDAVGDERVIEEVAKANKLNERFVEMAKDKKLKFEKKTEKVDEEDVDVWYVVGEKDGNKETTSLGKFFETDSFFSKFVDTFVDSSEGGEGNGSSTGVRKWISQETGKGSKGAQGAQNTVNNRYGGTVKSLTKQAEA